MSVALTYEADAPNDADAQRIVAFCRALAVKYVWSHESFWIDNDRKRRVVWGAFKYASTDLDSFIPGMRSWLKGINILCESAKEFGLCWRVSDEGTPWLIDESGPDEELRKAIRETKLDLDRAKEVQPRKPWQPRRVQRNASRPHRALRTRWDANDTESFLVSLFTKTTKARTIASPFGLTAEGRIDARGVDLEILRRRKPRLFESIRDSSLVIRNVDFSFSDTTLGKNWFESLSWRVRFLNCAFDGIEVKTFLCGRYQRCRFRGARIAELRCDVSHCDFSYGRLAGYVQDIQDCGFAGAAFKKTVMLGSFKNCDFSNANLNGVEMGEVHFQKCRFNGASFDSVFYADTVFQHCSGLMPRKMFEYSSRFIGERLCSRQDIIMVD